MKAELSPDPVNLLGHVSLHGELRSTPGYMAAERIRRFLRQYGNRGTAAISEIIEGDPSLVGLERQEILDQVLSYGKFNVIESGDEVYLSLTGNQAITPKRWKGLHQAFHIAVEQLHVPTIEELLKRRHPLEVADNNNIVFDDFMTEIAGEIDLLDRSTGLVSRVRDLCLPKREALERNGLWSVPVREMKKGVPEISNLPEGLLGVLLAHDGVDVSIRWDGKVQRIFLSKSEAERPEEALVSIVEAAERRQNRRQRLWDKILKAKGWRSRRSGRLGGASSRRSP